ncbi:hypothetical protein [Aurantiacibacter gangjinensis]|uniref:Uncharacterized protein n=1 Tax=Aurantiacibacter gangjinensis TaxID=502682 RepID=A0A0G9MVV1_9SPHN|nr:hypothetical protein [Aurantiacibacter gangjinensis]KLE33408.1 hypothetical protein AAW01_05635 [Aurantiacibacter gangjinensis]
MRFASYASRAFAATANDNPNRWDIFPTLRINEILTLLKPEQKSQNSAIFQNWHAVCNVQGMGRRTQFETEEGNKMTFANGFTARITSGLAAVAVTAMLLVSSFSTPEASIFTGIIA